MFTITVKNHFGIVKEFHVFECDYAIFHFKAFIQAIDVHEVVMINGLTGEVLYEWVDGKWGVFNGTVIKL